MFSTKEVNELLEKSIQRALDFYSEGNCEAAKMLFEQILQVDPGNLISLQVMGLIYYNLGTVGKSLECLEKAIELYPDNPDTYNNIALIYEWVDPKNIDKSINYIKKAIHLKSDMADWISNLASFYKKKNLLDKAEYYHKKATRAKEGKHRAFFNYGIFLSEQKRYDEAKKAYSKSILLKKDFAEAHYNLGIVNFLEGDLDKGWKEYEWRWNVFKHVRKDRYDKPFLTDVKQITGNKILLFAEQGCGDAIQFVRFANNLKRYEPKEIIIQCHKELVTLFQTMDNFTVEPVEKNILDFDFQIPLMSLPLLLGINLSNLSGKPYLTVNEKCLNKSLPIFDEDNWKKYDSYFKVGISWAGSPLHRNDMNRSCYLKDFKCLQSDNVKFFSLQQDTRSRLWNQKTINLIEGAEDFRTVNMQEYLTDFNHTAWIVNKMDLIISVDTSLVHLAGALGKDVWNLVSYILDWRWMEDRKDSPWYDSMKLIRKKEKESWNELFISLPSLKA